MSDTPRPAQTALRRSPLIITLAVVAAIVVGFMLFSGFYADVLWFDQLGFVQVLQVRWIAMAAMFAIGFLAMAVPLAVSMQIAFRSRPMYAQLSSQLDRYQELVAPLRRLAMWVVPAVFGLFAGLAAASRWDTALLWLNRQPFGEADAQFGLDASFYVFELPLYQEVVSFALAVLFACGLATIATAYLYGAVRVTGRELRISRSARIQIGIVVALWMAAFALSQWLTQYQSLTSPSLGGEVDTGPGFTEANAGIPGQQILAGIAALVAIFFIVTAVIGRWRLSLVGTALLVVASIIIGFGYPAIIQRIQVDPSAGTLELPYIQANIDATRAAYGVDELTEVDVDVETNPEAGALAADQATTANIRLQDPEVVGVAFSALQGLRQYYAFEESLDVDRYEIDGQTQDAVVALRELSPEFLQQQDWYNQHIIYTYGYGLVGAYGNQRTADGRPVFLQSGIPATGALGDFEPRIYFGENSPEYSIVGGGTDDDSTAETEAEGDPEATSAEGNIGAGTVTPYEGQGGPEVGGFLSRLVYAIKFQSEQILFSNAVADDSQILYNRDPLERVQQVAPYLTLDEDPYPSVVDGELVWIVDGYTTTSQYPYSTQTSLAAAIEDSSNPTPAQTASDTINYIRNSVKVVVNAFDGSVELYAWDAEDPILQAYQQIYPGTLRPVSEMSGDLLAHVRYPADMFKVQRDILGQYHVTDASAFYSGNDAWTTPADPTNADGDDTSQPPYYLTMAINGEEPAYSLYTTFIPPSSDRELLYGYLSVNSDAGASDGEVADSYGQLTLQNIPEDQQIPGPGQAQNNFDTDATVGNLLNILQQGQSRVVYGNLLTLPVGGGMLYVQPVYLQSTGSTSYPVLQRVLVSFGNEIAFEETLDAALDELFGGDSGATTGDEGIDPVEVDPATGEPVEGSGGDEGDGGTAPTGDLQSQLQTALQEAATALEERQAAYAENDVVGAAQADERLQAAVTEANSLIEQLSGLPAEGEDTGEATP
ncbi:UPF0182 family protein [Agrococcus versicolor]|uniref:UPF0182 protein GCM10009846_09740 n=1 Tax=Agrococcus versicolor TaxID=501482 RepID=A0ABN3ANH5_9MICO